TCGEDSDTRWTLPWLAKLSPGRLICRTTCKTIATTTTVAIPAMIATLVRFCFWRRELRTAAVVLVLELPAPAGLAVAPPATLEAAAATCAALPPPDEPLFDLFLLDFFFAIWRQFQSMGE